MPACKRSVSPLPADASFKSLDADAHIGGSSISNRGCALSCRLPSLATIFASPKPTRPFDGPTSRTAARRQQQQQQHQERRRRVFDAPAEETGNRMEARRQPADATPIGAPDSFTASLPSTEHSTIHRLAN